MPLVSVIVPIYNAEKYLEECACDILSQTIQDIELILVNDGSTDSSPTLCDTIASRDTRVRVIHKKNGRAASARNAGLRIASGEYVSFVDADDRIDKDMYEKMLSQNAEVCMCDYERFNGNTVSPFSQPNIDGGFYDKEAIRKKLYPHLVMDGIEFPITISNCVLLIKRSILDENNLKYREDILISEDAPFGSEVLYHANSFAYLKGLHLYHYRITDGSASKTHMPYWWDSFLKINEETENYFGNCPDFDFSQQIKSNMFYFARAEIYYILADNTLSRHEQNKAVRAVMNHPRTVRMLKDFNCVDAPFSLRCIFWSIRCRSVFMRRIVGWISALRNWVRA